MEIKILGLRGIDENYTTPVHDVLPCTLSFLTIVAIVPSIFFFILVQPCSF